MLLRILKIEAIDALIDTCKKYKLSAHDTAYVLVTARKESGFNKYAAAGSSTATGIGQFVIGTYKQLNIGKDKIWDLNTQAKALVLYYMSNRAATIRDGKSEKYIYKYHHDGPKCTREDTEGMIVTERDIMPNIKQIEEKIKGAYNDSY